MIISYITQIHAQYAQIQQTETVIYAQMEHISILVINHVMLIVHQDIMKIKIVDFVNVVTQVVNNVMVGMRRIVLNVYHLQIISICCYRICV